MAPAHIDTPDAALEDARLVLELSRHVTSSLNLQDVLDNTFAALRKLVDFGGGAIQLITDGYLVAVATDPPADPQAMAVKIQVGKGISGMIAATGDPIYIPNIWEDERLHPGGKRRGVSAGVVSYFGMPLIIQGEITGVLQIDSPLVDAFSPTVRARLLAFEPTIAAAVQHAQLYTRERRSRAELEHAEQLKRDFLALIPHELRTPLTTVAGFGHTLARHAHTLSADTIEDIGERIWRASRRLERVMGDLLDLSNIERGMLPVYIIPTDVEMVLSEAVREQADGRHELTLVVDAGLPRARIDGDRLHQMIGNLINNARKFSEVGSAIHVRASPAGEMRIAVSVSDEGRGVPEEAREHIFDRFWQLEPTATRSTEGLGVGLYLVKQLCDRMGVTIDLVSEPGATTFTLLLPVA